VRPHLWNGFAPRNGLASGLFTLLAAVSLCGCVETAADIAPGADPRPQFTRREDASLSAATLAIVSVDGAPAELSERFSQSLTEAAAARQIAVATPAKARYLVRGYLTAAPVEGGASIDFVWDIYTPSKQRAQRLSDAVIVKGSGDDAWAMVNEAALDSIAGKCADDLAAYLSNTPEAAPASAALSYAQ
jgi:hypothetical protein